MAQQVAAYETYLRYLKSGYSTMQDGLNTMHDLKDGTFTMHGNYFNSLSRVAPSVRGNKKIKGFTDLLAQLETTFDQALSWQQDKAILGGDEITYMQTVYRHLLEDCNTELEELTLVITDGKLQMTDEQRLKKIDGLYAAMQQQYSFARAFCDRAYQLAVSRNTDNIDRQVLKKLYDLN